MSNPIEKDVFFAVGLAVLTSQATERELKRFLRDFVPKLNSDDIEELFSDKKREGRPRPPTLGKIIGELKTRIPVGRDFGKTLDAFVKNRNKLIHHADEISGFSFKSPEDMKLAYDYSLDLYERAQHIIKVLLAFPIARPEIGLDLPLTEFFKTIKTDYAPLVDEAFPKNVRPKRKKDQKAQRK